jgi:predicted RNA-binding protein YlxR (DUF448 family)
VPRHEPERTCIVTRAVHPPEAMIRFVVGPDASIVPDLRQRLPGRGVWVTAERPLVEEAVRRRLFARAFKAQVVVSPTLAEEIERLLRDDLRQGLSLANKAGAVIAGFAKVESAAAQEPLAALIHATEAAEDGRRKIAARLRNRPGDAILDIPVVQELSNHELGLALGRSHVIHAALVAGAGSDGFLTRWHRYRSYRGIDAGQTGSSHSGAGEPTFMEPAGSERND